MDGKDLVDAILRTAAELAAASPDAVYTPSCFDGCSYFGGTAAGRDGCIFGQAMVDCGFDPAPFEADNPVFTIDNILTEINPDTDDSRLEWAGRLQRAQDTGYSWGAALSLAGPCPVNPR